MKTRAIVSVIGKDSVGIIAKVSAQLAQINANIEDISQTLMQGYFVMIMMVDLSESLPIAEAAEKLNALGESVGVSIHIQHEDIFNSMHRI